MYMKNDTGQLLLLHEKQLKSEQMLTDIVFKAHVTVAPAGAGRTM